MKNSLVLFLLMFPMLLLGQQKQPKVGLVLSGGGAKGFAHIAILKEIDKAGVQLDYIGGTSMGAIIGGFYAAGYSANQIEEIILKTDFLTLLRDDLPRSSETFFEKEFGEKTVITLPVNKGKIGLPKGVSKGQNILNLLLELFDSVDGNQDFSKLPIPFFCIATDVENGAPVILEKGSLPISLRASGSFPSLLNPVVIEDKLLIDGGIANNFPVSIMRDKGMDIVIGVDVEGKLFQKDKINSVVALLNQIMSYQMYSKTDEEIKKLDVYIHPEIFDYTVVDFDKKAEIIEKGAVEAKKYAEVFKQIATKQVVKKKRKTIKFSNEKLKISEVGIHGQENYTRAYILGKLNIKEGDSLSRHNITEKIYLLSATRNFNRIEYNLIKKVDDSYLLDFNIRESNEKANLKLGIHYDHLYKSGIIANYNHKSILKKNDMLSLNVVFGDNLRYDFTYFVDNGFYTSYGFRSRYNHFRSQVPFNEIASPNIKSVNLKYSDFTNEIFLQTTFNRKFALGVGVEVKKIQALTDNISPLNNNNIADDSVYFNVLGYLKLDTYNKKYFATKGVFADLGFKWYLLSSDFANNFERYAQAKGKIGFATSFWDNFTLQYTGEAGFSLREVESDVFNFQLGGNNQNYINNFISFYGYEFADLSDKSFVKSEFNVRYRFLPKHYFSAIANYARLDSNVFKDIDLFKNIKSGYAVGYSYDSFLGPIELKYSWSPDKNENVWLFNLGFWF
ncbi:patatin-like phospholipase family protein [Polaribacter cellanae]|uniref:Patatin-like phospholipase family protein n=1 Tax=Polaribacter cellanae TaxID=2818493 RepID=A0A975HAB4_9FLAO|nr:patatin-like phospholipase family protein [Polaribacter cellanae]QTE24135.1 patatin-like phospholipase family protein [Polaribacter cellanae]